MLLLPSPVLMWSTGNFKLWGGDVGSRRSLFGRDSYLQLDGSSKVDFYNWSNVEFLASGHTTLSKWASCFSWAFVNNLQRDFKPNQLEKVLPGPAVIWRAKVDRGELSAAPELLPCSCAWHIQEHWGHWHVELGDPPDLRKAERTPRAWAASRQLKNFLMQVPSWYEENFRNPASGYVFSAKSHLSCVSCKNQIRNSDRWELLKTYMLFCFLKGFWQVV